MIATQKPKEQNAVKQEGIVALLSKLKITMPKNYNWKQDYIKALEEKHANIHRH